MAYNVTLLQFRTKVRQRTDTVNAQTPTDPELTDYINDSISELWDLLVTTYGEDYYQILGATFPTVNNTALYALNGVVCPSNDFFKLAGLDILQQGTGAQAIYVPLTRFMSGERTRGQGVGWMAPAFRNVRYRLTGTNLEFVPTPSGIYTIRPRYVPTATLLVGDSDVFDSINGWHEYVIADVCGKVMEKFDLNADPFTSRKMSMAKRISDSAPNRDQGEANRVVDVTGLTGDSDDYFDQWR